MNINKRDTTFKRVTLMENLTVTNLETIFVVLKASVVVDEAIQRLKFRVAHLGTFSLRLLISAYFTGGFEAIAAKVTPSRGGVFTPYLETHPTEVMFTLRGGGGV